MTYELRDYQVSIIEEVRSRMRKGHHSILVTAPTGSGKTLLTAHMLKAAAEKRMGSYFVVHRRELVKQSIRAFRCIGVDHGVVASGFLSDPRPYVQIASVQTLKNRLEKARSPKLMVWDEAHHICASSWASIFKAFPDAFHIGLTATPQRLDGKGLKAFFETMVEGPTVSELIRRGFLSDYRLFAPPSINVAGLHTRMGDFVKSELALVADKPSVTGDAIREYRKCADGKQAVVFCVSVEHSQHVASQFQAAGYRAAELDGETETDRRDQILADFAAGRIQVVTNCEILGEGFDVPGIEAAILLRPTQSLGLYLQQCGRALRPAPGKVRAIILDHAGNCQRHGLPDDEREWSLEGTAGVKRDGTRETGAVRVCTKCFAAQWSGSTVCSFCGTAFEIQTREIEFKDGDLEEINREALRRQKKKQQTSAESLEDLIALGKARGYKRPSLWAKYIFRARMAYRGREK